MVAASSVEAALAFFDSNSLYAEDAADLLHGHAFKSLSECMRFTGCRFYVPEMVLYELTEQAFVRVSAARDKLRDAQKTFRAHFSQDALPLPNNLEVRHYVEAGLKKLFSQTRVELLPIPYQNFDLAHFVGMALRKEPPFHNTGNISDTGFKDAVIAETIMLTVDAHPNAHIYLVSKDGKLSAALKQRCSSREFTHLNYINELQSHLTASEDQRTFEFVNLLLAAGPKAFFSSGEKSLFVTEHLEGRLLSEGHKAFILPPPPEPDFSATNRTFSLVAGPLFTSPYSQLIQSADPDRYCWESHVLAYQLYSDNDFVWALHRLKKVWFTVTWSCPKLSEPIVQNPKLESFAFTHLLFEDPSRYHLVRTEEKRTLSPQAILQRFVDNQPSAWERMRFLEPVMHF